jgi:hypothetical protein
MGTLAPPPPFEVWTDVESTMWINDALQPWGQVEDGTLVGQIVPSGFEAYARVFHPARRSSLDSREQQAPLRWTEIARARGCTAHPEMQIEALMDEFHGDHWGETETGEFWSPPHEWLDEDAALALASVLQPFSSSIVDAWFMLWDGYGDFGAWIDSVPRGVVGLDRSEHPRGEFAHGTWALRHYLMFRGPLEGLPAWFDRRYESPNYWWPDDRTWIVATEIDGYSTYVGGSTACIDAVLGSPLLEALPSSLDHRFDMRGDSINT